LVGHLPAVLRGDIVREDAALIGRGSSWRQRN